MLREPQKRKRPRRCRVKPCRNYIPATAPDNQDWCSADCGTTKAMKLLAKQQETERRATRAAERERNRQRRADQQAAAERDVDKQAALTQDAFNEVVRLLDAYAPLHQLQSARLGNSHRLRCAEVGLRPLPCRGRLPHAAFRLPQCVEAVQGVQ